MQRVQMMVEVSAGASEALGMCEMLGASAGVGEGVEVG